MLRALAPSAPQLFKDRTQSLKRATATKEILQVPGVSSRKALTAGKPRIESGAERLMAKTIVFLATFGSTQDRVRLRDLFKFLFGSGITGVHVRMILPC